MTNQHPISVPDELLRQWCQQIQSKAQTPEELWRNIANTSAQWGADQELEACCEWLRGYTSDHMAIYFLRADRRHKPPSLKEQALSELNLTADSDGAELSRTQVELIRRALETL